MRKNMCPPGFPAGTCLIKVLAYPRVIVLLTLLSYVRMRIAATSLRLNACGARQVS